MTAKTELAPRQQTLPAVEPQSEAGALMHIIERYATDPNLDVAKLREMLDVKKEWEAQEARKTFLIARSNFAANAPRVLRDKVNPQYGSKYSSLENVVWTLAPKLSEYGLSADWRVKQESGMIFCTCILSHEAGHSESITLFAPPDESGKKNAIQQIKSTLTYLRTVTFEMITGTASVEANLSDDGNSFGNEPLSDEQDATIREYIEALGDNIDLSKFCRWLQVETIDDIPASKYQMALTQLKRKQQAVSK